MRKRAKRQLWVGLVEGKIHFYRNHDYYGGVLHADLFPSRRAAKICYDAVRPLRRMATKNLR